MSYRYSQGELFVEDVAVKTIADQLGTPFYCYSTEILKQNYKAFADSLSDLDSEIFFALKANSNLGVLATLARLGCGADVVSLGELKRALVSGIPANKIVFSGVGKTVEELGGALSSGIKQFNIESEPELAALSEEAIRRRCQAPIAIRINPNVDAKTHFKITTGINENKFGISINEALSLFAKASELKGIIIKGLAVHIGSQLTDLAPYREAYLKINKLVKMLKGEGYSITDIDLGGGLGISYKDETPPTPLEYGLMVKDTVGKLGCSVGFEPGRFIVGEAGILVAKIVYVKKIKDRSILIVDAGMNDLLRPALYDAYHEVSPVKDFPRGSPVFKYDVVGPICETSDTFGTARSLPKMQAGDLIAFRNAGAYCSVMASTYNSRPLVPEVLVRGMDYSVVAERLSIEQLIERESIPPWLEKDGNAEKSRSE